MSEAETATRAVRVKSYVDKKVAVPPPLHW
jgi:hypothetical protein